MTFDGSGTELAGGGEPVVDPAADGKEADRQLRRIARGRAALDVEEARWLLVGRRAGIHVPLGYVTFLEYMERVLGHGARAAQERLRVAEALETLPRIREALASGDTSYSVVREVTRVATSENQVAWIEAVRGRTVRDVEAMVRGRRHGDGPDDAREPELQPRVLRFEVLPDTYALFRDAQRAARQEVGHMVSDDEVIAWLCRKALRADGEAGDGPPYQVALMVCEECERATQDGGGEVIDVGPAVVAAARCDATELGRVDGGPPARTTQTLTEARRLRIFRRDHGRCTVPGCRSAAFLQVHHIVAREDGGGHLPGNLTLLCGGHHRALHEGRLGITGEAPRGLRFLDGEGRAWG